MSKVAATILPHAPEVSLTRCASLTSFDGLTNVMYIQVWFAIRALQSPLSIPLLMASFKLTRDSIRELSDLVRSFEHSTSRLSSDFTAARAMYDVMNIENHVPNGDMSYPAEQHSCKEGMSLEFR